MDQQQIINEAIRKFGMDRQIRKSIEEMGELIVAINHYADGKTTYEELCGEIADVIIMAKQLQVMFGVGVDDKIEEKFNRLGNLLGVEYGQV